VKSFVAAVAFLTRLPVGRLVSCDAADVARSAGWFPMIGIFLGSFYWLSASLLRGHLPLAVIGVILVALDAAATGALHFDGLADTADGFGGGKTREDVLRIMRDHAIGTYGGLALAIVVACKTAAYATLLNRNGVVPALILTPALGRWAMLLLTATLPYARASASVIGGMGKRSLVVGTLTVLAANVAARSPNAWIATGIVVVTASAFGFFCRRRIGGITGDTLGANLQLCECAALLAFLWTGHPK